MASHEGVSARVRIRPIRNTDRDELSAFYAGLSSESRLARFHAVSRGIGDQAASRLCAPDHEHREGFVAELMDAEPGGPGMIGHLCLEPGDSGLEMAVAVADNWQDHGIGRALLLAAVDWATDHDILRLEAWMLSTNSAILGLLASTGRTACLSTPSAGVVLATIDVGRALPRVARPRRRVIRLQPPSCLRRLARLRATAQGDLRPNQQAARQVGRRWQAASSSELTDLGASHRTAKAARPLRSPSAPPIR